MTKFELSPKYRSMSAVWNHEHKSRKVYYHLKTRLFRLKTELLITEKGTTSFRPIKIGDLPPGIYKEKAVTETYRIKNLEEG